MVKTTKKDSTLKCGISDGLAVIPSLMMPKETFHELGLDIQYSKKPNVGDGVTKIVVNKEAKCVVVKFFDGTEQVIHCGEDDIFDSRVGVALALVYHSFGSKTQFKDFIRGKSYFVSSSKK